MNAINWKKLLLPNIPYLLFVYLFDKVEQAVRLAPGADLSGKVLSLGEGFSMAFANPLPSLAPMDLLIGIFGAVLIRLIVYVKGKNAKKYRKGVEYGSARWGTAEDIRPYTDPVFQNNVLLTQTERLTMNSRPKQPKYARNKNILVIGGSGSGKTRFFVKPNLMQMHSSYVVTDPKGTVLVECGKLLQRGGYRIKVLNTINFKKSMRYNPFAYLRSEKDILKLVTTLIANTKGDGKSGDDFWQKAETLLYTALIALLRDWFPAKDYNMSSLLTLLSLAEARENDENFKSALDLMFLQIEEGKKYKQNDGTSPDTAGTAGLSRSFGTKQADNGWSWVPSKFKRNSDGVKPADCGGLSADEDFALMNYKNFKVAAGKTLKSILISCNVRLAPIATDGVRELLTYDEMEIDTLGDPDAKVAIFGILSDTDKTLSFLFAILMWQTIDQLCRKALSDYGGKLPTPVHFIFDEFANIGTIPQIEETIAVTRSRNIGITIILQSMSQLESKYDKKAQTIIDCCDSTLFLGGKSNSTNKEIAEMIGKQTIHQMTYNESTGQSSSASKNLQIQGRDLIDAAEIGKMSRLKAILLIAGTNPLMDDKYDPHAHKRYRYIVDKRNWKRLHKNSFDFERYLKNGCEPYTPDEDTGAEFTAWKWAAWKESRKGLLGILLNR